MAVLKGGMLHGKVGDLIYYTRKGVPCVRTAPKKSSGPPSPAPRAQRLRMKVAMRFLTPPTPVLEKTVKAGDRSRMAGINWATKQVLEDAIGGEYPDLYVQPERVLVSTGRVPRLRGVGLSGDEAQRWTFTWNAVESLFIDI